MLAILARARFLKVVKVRTGEEDFASLQDVELNNKKELSLLLILGIY